ncbi:MAG: tyrosine-type recombinase/integrase [Desulfuromonadales bacterium]
MGVIDERKTKEGKPNFRARVRLKGYPQQVATFSRKTDAKKWIQETETFIRDGRYFKTVEAKKHTFGNMIDKYIRDVIPNRSKGKDKQIALVTWWKGELGEYCLADVTSSMIGEQRDRLLREKTYRGSPRSPATVVRYLAALSHVYSVAVKEWEWLESNPVRRVRKPTEPRGRVRFLNEVERKSLLAECFQSDNKLLYPIVILAISTGMRQGEIFRLKWADIDFKRHQLVIHETKNNERRVVPIVSVAHKALKEYGKVRQLDSEFVFPAAVQSGGQVIRKAWASALEKAKITDFRFHDLRHSAASYLAMNGATLAEIAEVLGHKTLAMVKRYAHMSDAHTMKVVERMNEHIFGIENE